MPNPIFFNLKHNSTDRPHVHIKKASSLQFNEHFLLFELNPQTAPALQRAAMADSSYEDNSVNNQFGSTGSVHPHSSSNSPPNDVLYIRSTILAQLSLQNAHINQDRPLLVNALLSASGVLDLMNVEEARPATIDELRQYHSTEYLAALANYHLFSQRQLAVYGLEDDCTPYPKMFEHAALCAGGSLQAAASLAEGRCRAAIHLDGGGRHHARKARAAGFCFINDVVLSILRLMNTYQRVLYIDVDCHHGDAVEESFVSTNRVLSISMHHASAGYFPGTGALGATGEGVGAGFSLNLPLNEGLKDGIFTHAFSKLCGGAVQSYRPDCVVLVCGVDGLAADPIGRAWSLTPAAYGTIMAQAASWGLPLLMLGGGGYDSPSAACAWTAAVAGVLGCTTLPEDVPDHEYLDRYGPLYSMATPGRMRSLAPDLNNVQQVDVACDGLLAVLGAAIVKRNHEVEMKAAAHAMESNNNYYYNDTTSNSGGFGGESESVQLRKRMKVY